MVIITSLIGIFGVAAALNGYLFRQMNVLVRILFAAGGLLMMDPSTTTDVIGVAIFAIAFIWQYVSAKRAAPSAAA